MSTTSHSATAVATILLLAACAAPSPTPAPEMATSFAAAGDRPVVAHDAAIGYLLSGALITDGEALHLYPVAFSTEAGQSPSVLHLVSTDGGHTWSGDRELPSLLDGETLGLDGNGPIPSAGLRTAEGRWLLYGGGRLAGTDRPVIWRAEAPSPDGPWELDPRPVLEPSEDGWDDLVTDHPSVVETGEGFVMAYGGATRTDRNRNRIGFAVSDDGRSWTRIAVSLPGGDDADALGPNACGIDARSIFEPHLVPLDDGYGLLWGAMLEGTDRMVVGAATGTDGRSWTCAADGPVVGPDDLPGAPDLHSFVVAAAEGRPLVLVEALLTGGEGSDLWLLLPTADSG